MTTDSSIAVEGTPAGAEDGQVADAPPAVASSRMVDAERIIHKDMLLAMGVGVVPIPLVDFIGVTAVQLRMLRRLAELYQTPFSKRDTGPLVSALVGGALPAFAAWPVASLVRWIPVVGWTLGSASMVILSGASTYAVGKVFAQHFERGGSISDFDTGAAKDEFLAFLHLGKEKAAKLKTAAQPEVAEKSEASV